MAILGPGIAGSFKPFKGRERSVSIRIIGLSKLTTDFDKLRSKSDGIMTQEIHKTATRIAKQANRDVPVDTGRLLRSIKVEKWTRAAAILVSAPYALFVEKGTSRMKAQPYFFKHFPREIKMLTENIKRLLK